MRIVLDSPVLIAVHISRAGVCAELFEVVLTQHELFISQFILDELTRKLTGKFRFPATDVRAIVRFLKDAALCVDPLKLPDGVCRDPEDAPILGTAMTANAALLISVDKDLPALETFRGIHSIRPGEFWKRAAKKR